MRTPRSSSDIPCRCGKLDVPYPSSSAAIAKSLPRDSGCSNRLPDEFTEGSPQCAVIGCTGSTPRSASRRKHRCEAARPVRKRWNATRSVYGSPGFRPGCTSSHVANRRRHARATPSRSPYLERSQEWNALMLAGL